MTHKLERGDIAEFLQEVRVLSPTSATSLHQEDEFPVHLALKASEASFGESKRTGGNRDFPFFFFGHGMQQLDVGSQCPDQGLSLGCSGESTES